MRDFLATAIDEFIDNYARANAFRPMWRPAVVKLGDANHPRLPELKSLVAENHLMPGELLPDATTMISYFLPFDNDTASDNVNGRLATPRWAEAYLVTNRMAEELNRHLVATLRKTGHAAAAPAGSQFNKEALTSRWSRRQIAWFSGHGTVGINNMLISDAGCCGRYFSLVCDAVVDHDPVVTEERCLYKAAGKCGLCVKRCVGNALTPDSFDRQACWRACEENEGLYGADVCGKCDVGLPCSSRVP